MKRFTEAVRDPGFWVKLIVAVFTVGAVFSQFQQENKEQSRRIEKLEIRTESMETAFTAERVEVGKISSTLQSIDDRTKRIEAFLDHHNTDRK